MACMVEGLVTSGSRAGLRTPDPTQKHQKKRRNTTESLKAAAES